MSRKPVDQNEKNVLTTHPCLAVAHELAMAGGGLGLARRAAAGVGAWRRPAWKGRLLSTGAGPLEEVRVRWLPPAQRSPACLWPPRWAGAGDSLCSFSGELTLRRAGMRRARRARCTSEGSARPCTTTCLRVGTAAPWSCASKTRTRPARFLHATARARPRVLVGRPPPEGRHAACVGGACGSATGAGSSEGATSHAPLRASNRWQGLQTTSCKCSGGQTLRPTKGTVSHRPAPRRKVNVRALNGARSHPPSHTRTKTCTRRAHTRTRTHTHTHTHTHNVHRRA